MKFSISFKYSNVTFKNKETKETVTYDSKAEGNTFTFDNVDEDVVLGIVKGIKDKKASQVFSYDDFRTNFINVMARNKCKELYDKIDKGDWKVDDIAISNITIKDLEFTKPTMNAREALTVESIKPNKGNTIFIQWRWSSEYDAGESGTEKIKVDDISEENIKRKVREFCNREWPEVGPYCDNVYVEVFVDLIPNSKPTFLFDGSFSYGEVEWYEDDGEEHSYGGGIYVERRKRLAESYWMTDYKWNEPYEVVFTDGSSFTVPGKSEDPIKFYRHYNDESYWNIMHNTYGSGLELGKTIDHFNMPSGHVVTRKDIQDEVDFYHDELKAKLSLEESGSKEEIEVEFKKTPDDGTVIAFFPQTMHDGSCNPGNIMSYEHNGQHGEASIDYYKDCTTCLEEDYASLLHELEGIYDDCELVVV